MWERVLPTGCVARTALHIWTVVNYLLELHLLVERTATGGITAALPGAFNTPKEPLANYKKHLAPCVRLMRRDNVLIITGDEPYVVSRVSPSFSEPAGG